jgi:hypothetical protein
MKHRLCVASLVAWCLLAAGCSGSGGPGGVDDLQRREAATRLVQALIVERDAEAAGRLAQPSAGGLDGYVEDAFLYDLRPVRGPLPGCSVPSPFGPLKDTPCWRFRLRGAKIDSADPSSGWGVIWVGWLQVAVDRDTGKTLVTQLNLVGGGKRVRIPDTAPAR